MDSKETIKNKRDRFQKLSLKKNKKDNKKVNRSSDIIVIDESFDRLISNLSNNVQSAKVYSPIIINESCSEQSFEELPNIKLSNKESSKNGNISFNCSYTETSPIDTKESCPSTGGWSPAQGIMSTVPKQTQTPSKPTEVANESLEECSIKKIQQSQKKLLNDLYGEVWKSIPTLFKTISHNHNNINGVTKKLQFNDDDDDSDKENVRFHIQENKKLYLTNSEVKRRIDNDFIDTEKKSKKKLYTEKIPNTPEPPKPKAVKRNVNSTSKKLKGKSVTELVEIMRNDVDLLGKKMEDINFTPIVNDNRLSFMGSLIDNVRPWRCHPEAMQYHDNFISLREQLSRRLFTEFNKVVFESALHEDLPILWDSKLRKTAGTTTNRLIKNSKGDRLRSSSIKLSSKVVDAAQRLRDTLIHELCHAATWLIDGELRAGHGPLWKKWAMRALHVFPELGEISRCHDMEIHYKYTYKCTKCGYSIKRHSKSIDVTKKCCGYCRGTFDIIVNKKKKDGVVVSTPARKGEANGFALYVKENYGLLKDGTRSHAEVMKTLGEQFSAKKVKHTS